MKVYVNGRLVAVETNVPWALPYWQTRRALRDRHVRITWEFV